MAPRHRVAQTPGSPIGAQEAATSSREAASTKRSPSSRAAPRRLGAPPGGQRLPAWREGTGRGGDCNPCWVWWW